MIGESESERGPAPCPECGARLGDRSACQAAWDAFAVDAMTDARAGALRDLAFDAYCMQHPATYCRSAKSYTAHLSRLACGLEHGGAQSVYAAIQRWLDGRAAVEKPDVPEQRGVITIADIDLASDRVEQTIRAWAENVWAAYAAQHELARGWIDAALAASARGRGR